MNKERIEEIAMEVANGTGICHIKPEMLAAAKEPK